MERDNIKDQLTSDNLGEATRLLGQKWKALSKEEKQVNQRGKIVMMKLSSSAKGLL